jgi:ATP-binding cassette subfamily F protein uup
LIAFPGVVCVVSHDRYFLNRVCTDILAFEGDGKIHHSIGDYDYYLEKKQRQVDATPRREEFKISVAAEKPRTAKPRKLSFKEQRELEGIETQIQNADAEIARIEGLFADPEFFRKHATQVNQLTAELEAAKENLPKLYARWEELEAIRLAAAVPSVG